MAEQIKLLDLDINYEKLVKGAADAKAAVQALTEQLKQQKADGQTSAEQIEITTAALKTAQNEYRANAKVLADLTAAGKTQNLTVDQMRKALSVVSAQWAQLTEDEIKNTEAGKQLSAQKLELTNKLKQLEGATGDNRRNVGNYTESMLAATQGTGLFGESTEKAVTILNTVREELIVVRNGFIASAEGATGFSGALKIVQAAVISTGIGALIIGIGLLIDGLIKFTPIVSEVKAYLAGLGAVINQIEQYLVRAFSNPKEIIASLGRFLEQNITNRFQAIKSILGDIIKGFTDLIHLDFKALAEDAKNLAGHFITLQTGIKASDIANLKEAFNGLADSISKAAQAGYDLEKAQEALDFDKKALEVANAQREAEAKRFDMMAKDMQYSLAQRQEFEKEALRIRNESLDKTKEVDDREIKQLQDQAALKASINRDDLLALAQWEQQTDEIKKALLDKYSTNGAVSGISKERKEFIDQMSELLKAQAQLEEQQIAQQGKSNDYRDKLAEQAAKRAEELAKQKAEAIIKGLEAEEKAFELHNRTLIEGDKLLTLEMFDEEDRRNETILLKKKEAIMKQFHAQEDAALQTIKDQELLEQTLYNLKVQKDNALEEEEQKYLDTRKANLKRLAQDSIKAAEEELALLRELNQSKIEQGKYVTDQMVKQEIERLLKLKEAQDDIDKQSFDKGLITAEQYQTKQLESERAFLDAQRQLYDSYKQQEAERRAIDFDNEMQIRQLQGESALQLKLEQLQREHDLEIANADKTGADKARIDQKYELTKEKLQRDAQNSYLQMTANGLGQVAELLGKNTVAGKAAAIAQATINTYLGVTSVLKDDTVPTFLKPALVAVDIATGLAAVANIVKTPTKFAVGGVFEHDGYGGVLPGYSKYDNINAQLRGGEGIVVSEAMQDPVARNLVSAINTAYGGRDFSVPGYSIDGGLTSRALQPDIASAEMVSAAVATAIKNVTIVTDVKDIITETGKRNLLVDNANL